MDEDQVQGVTSEETTSGISPNVNQTTQEDTNYSAEEQSNTEVSDSDGTVEDKRIPYDRFQEKVAELNEMKVQMAELKAKAEVADRLGQAFNPDVSSPEQRARQQQLDAARKELEQMGYVDKTTVDQLVEQKLSAYKWQERFVNQMDQLANKYTGKDGGPKFDKDEIARFMDDQMAKGNQITDPELAFKIMHMDQLAESKAKAQKSSTYSEKPGGSVHTETDQRKADLAAASKTGNIQDFLKKYVNIPD
jgi:uncharacterized protein YydD (DUF2326 family)